jgi:hypothetical protein
MDTSIQAAGLAAAALCAATMGFAIQRGGTCTVAAVDELLRERRGTRLLALVEAALWVGGGLLVALRLGWLDMAPTAFSLTGWTLLGAALLGFGAFINRACVFGAIARLGSGEWAFVATPIGFYLGCVSVGAVFGGSRAQPLHGRSPLLDAPGWLVLAFTGFAAWRIAAPWLRPTRTAVGRSLACGRWSPHMATTVIGVTFLAMLLLAGAWAYTDVLAEIARGMAQDLPARIGLLLCLLAGAAVGGWTAGRWRAAWPRWPDVSRCAAGGVMMGWGSLLIPGGNDGLILLGMPLLWPYAWAAFLTMCLAISLPQWLLLRRAAT